MKHIILVVEDDESILLSIKQILYYNGFEPVTASNGQIGIQTLFELKRSPSLIISDIKMPEMNGYDFFSEVSKYKRFKTIPFIFLTALSSPEDVRLGKLLGVDDYIIKPFDKKYLLASIYGILNRYEKIAHISKDLQKIKFENKNDLIKIRSEMNLIVMFSIWDEKLGPEVTKFFPKNIKLSIPLNQLSTQLFQTTISIYGYSSVENAEGILLKISNLNKMGYIFFDYTTDDNVRGKKRQFMFSVIAQDINYLESLKIKIILNLYSIKVKKFLDWEISDVWNEIRNVID